MTKKWGIWWGFLFHRCDGWAQRRVPWLLFVTTRCTDDVAAVGLYRGGLWTGVVKVPSPPKRAQARCVLRYYWEYYMPRYAHVWSRIFKGYVECSCDWVTPSHMFDVRTWISEVKYLCLADLFRTCWHCVIFRHSKYHALQDKLEPVSRKIFSAWAAIAKKCDHSHKEPRSAMTARRISVRRAPCSFQSQQGYSRSHGLPAPHTYLVQSERKQLPTKLLRSQR